MSNARNLARLLPNASGQLPTGNLQDAAVTNAKLVNGYPNVDIVRPVGISHVNLGAANTYYNLASIQIPSPGIWKVFSHCRWGGPSSNPFIRLILSTTTGNGGTFTNSRMQLEQPVSNGGNFNLGSYSEWHIDCGLTGSYPMTIYLGAFQGNAAASLFITQDSNGTNEFGAVKMATTTYTGSSPTGYGA